MNLGVTRSNAGTKEKEIRNQFYVSWPMGFEIVGSKTTWWHDTSIWKRVLGCLFSTFFCGTSILFSMVGDVVAGHFLHKNRISSSQQMGQRKSTWFSKSILMSCEFRCVSVCLLSKLFSILGLIHFDSTIPRSLLLDTQPLLQTIPTRYVSTIHYSGAPELGLLVYVSPSNYAYFITVNPYKSNNSMT